MGNQGARITALETKVDALEKRVAALEGVPEPPPPPPPVTADMWGGIAGWSLANTRIGDGTSFAAWSFIAKRALALVSFRAYFTGGPGYGEGTGGTYTFHIRPDNGSGAPDLTQSFGKAERVTGFPPGVGNAPGKLIALSGTAPLTLGRRYWVVMENVDSAPSSNNTSANALWSKIPTPAHWRFADQLDWQFMYSATGSSWSARRGYAMCCQLDYSDGYAQGNPFMEMSYSDIPEEVGDIDAAGRMVRQPFSPGPAKALTAGICAQKRAGSTGPLTIALRSGPGRGTVLDSLTVPASAIPDGAMTGGDINGSADWAGGSFASPKVLPPAAYLEFSAAGNSRFLTWPVRLGSFYGYSKAIDAAFPGGLPWQYSLDGGASWTNGAGNDDQLSAYLGYA